MALASQQPVQHGRTRLEVELEVLKTFFLSSLFLTECPTSSLSNAWPIPST